MSGLEYTDTHTPTHTNPTCETVVHQISYHASESCLEGCLETRSVSNNFTYSSINSEYCSTVHNWQHLLLL